MDDRKIARRSSEFLDGACEYRLVDVPGYMAWSQRKLTEGVSDALIAHLDATSMALAAEELREITDEIFDDLLADLQG